MVSRQRPIPYLLLLSLVLILPSTRGQDILRPKEFYEGILAGLYDAVIDTRTLDEWDAGHIVNATLIESLQLQSSDDLPPVLNGCEGSCRTIVVYCQSGNRAGTAIDLLIEAGFNGTIYNGLGVSQWTDAGYELVNTPSVEPFCSAQSVTRALTCPDEINGDRPTDTNGDGDMGGDGDTGNDTSRSDSLLGLSILFKAVAVIVFTAACL